MAVALIPELGLTRPGRGQRDDTGYENITKNLRVRRLEGGELSTEVDGARADDQGRVLWEALTSRGLRPESQLAYGTRARLGDEGGYSGYFVAIPFASGDGRRAKLHYGIDMLGKHVAFASEWQATSPEIIDVSEVRGSRPFRRSTVRVAGETAVVEFADGRLKSADLSPLIHQGKAGLASVAAGPCSVNGLACVLACGTVVEWSCVYEFSVVCGGITALCPPCGGFCELVTIVVCTVTSIVSCYYVCQPC
jgi:hypothetical protein